MVGDLPERGGVVLDQPQTFTKQRRRSDCQGSLYLISALFASLRFNGRTANQKAQQTAETRRAQSHNILTFIGRLRNPLQSSSLATDRKSKSGQTCGTA